MKRFAISFALILAIVIGACLPVGMAHAQGTLTNFVIVKAATDKAFVASQKDTSSGTVGAHNGDRIASATYITSVITVSDTVSVERTVQYRPFGATAWTTVNKDTVTQAASTALVVNELAIRSATTDLAGKISGYIRVVCFFLASGNGDTGGTYTHRIFYKP